MHPIACIVFGNLCEPLPLLGEAEWHTIGRACAHLSSFSCCKTNKLRPAGTHVGNVSAAKSNIKPQTEHEWMSSQWVLERLDGRPHTHGRGQLHKRMGVQAGRQCTYVNFTRKVMSGKRKNAKRNISIIQQLWRPYVLNFSLPERLNSV